MKLKFSIFSTFVLSSMALPAFAHYPLTGGPMNNFGQAMLSGIGHPIFGFDHLFFMVAVGITAVFTSRNLIAPLYFVGGMLVGVGVIFGDIQLPMVELVIALSLVAFGATVLAGKALSFNVAVGMFVVLGVFHGWAFGETLVGQDSGFKPTALVGYLIGLAVTLWLIAVSTGYVMLKVWKTSSSNAIQPRLAGAVVAGVGAIFTFEIGEKLLFASMRVSAGA